MHAVGTVGTKKKTCAIEATEGESDHGMCVIWRDKLNCEDAGRPWNWQ